MSWTVGPVDVSALLIGAAGVAKLSRPAGTAQALADARLPGLARPGTAAAQAVGVAEILLGAAALAWGSTLTTALVAAVQVVFAAFALRLLSTRGGAASCGCFGASQAPVHPIHVGLNLVMAATAGVAAAWPPGPVTDLVRGQPLAGIPLIGLVLLGTWVVFLAFTSLPELLVTAADLAPEDAS